MLIFLIFFNPDVNPSVIPCTSISYSSMKFLLVNLTNFLPPGVVFFLVHTFASFNSFQGILNLYFYVALEERQLGRVNSEEFILWDYFFVYL